MYVNKFWLFSLLSSVSKGVTTAQQQKRELYYKLDTILITALQNEFEIWPGHTVDRQDMVEYLRSVVLEHIADCPELEKILNLRDTVLTGRVKRAFPGVEYKRKQMRQDHYRKAYLFCGIAWGGVVQMRPKSGTLRKPGVCQFISMKPTVTFLETLKPPPLFSQQRKKVCTRPVTLVMIKWLKFMFAGLLPTTTTKR